MTNPHRKLLIAIGAYAIAASIALGQDSLELGNPGCDVNLHDREFADRKFFQLCHNYDLKVPLWVGEKLVAGDIGRKNKASRKGLRFKEDKGTFDPDVERTRAKDSDYTFDKKEPKSARYSRGHMAAAEDMSRSREALASTFILSNAVPQKQGVNGGRWKDLEKMVRDVVKRQGTGYVFTGPVFEHKTVPTMGAKHGDVGIPDKTFKVALLMDGDNNKTMYAWIMPNLEKVPLDVMSYAVTVREVEDKTGFSFFTELGNGERERLETAKAAFPPAKSKQSSAKKKVKK